MALFYDILFSIEVLLDGKASTDFYIIPTPECREKMNSLGLIFKRLENKVIVIVEKIGDDQASASPTRKMSNGTDFTFLLNLDNKKLLNGFKPFNRPLGDSFPPYSGRSRNLYFNNLTPGSVIKDPIDILTKGAQVDDADLSSISLNKFGYTEQDPSVDLKDIEFKKIHTVDNISIKPFDSATNNRTVQVELEESAYVLTRDPAAKETLFAQSSLLAFSAIGIIQIFKDEMTSSLPEIHHKIPFVTS